MTEPEVPDEAYIAAAIADHGFAVVRSNACGMPQARVGFKQPHRGYSSDGSVSISEARARECMTHEHDTAEPADHPAAAELPAADPGDTEAELKPDPPKKLKKPRKKPTT